MLFNANGARRQWTKQDKSGSKIYIFEKEQESSEILWLIKCQKTLVAHTPKCLFPLEAKLGMRGVSVDALDESIHRDWPGGLADEGLRSLLKVGREANLNIPKSEWLVYGFLCTSGRSKLDQPLQSGRTALVRCMNGG